MNDEKQKEEPTPVVNVPTTVPPSSLQSQNPIIRLVSSSKALVVLGVTTACFIALFAGKAQFHDITEFLKYIIGPWLVAQGLEDALKKKIN